MKKLIHVRGNIACNNRSCIAGVSSRRQDKDAKLIDDSKDAKASFH